MLSPSVEKPLCRIFSQSRNPSGPLCVSPPWPKLEPDFPGPGMSVPTIRGVIRRNLLIVFVIALFAGGGGFYLLLRNAAMTNAEDEARLLLSSAMAIRGYTTQHILPNLTKLHDAVFHEETVPAFAAQ